MYVCEVIMNTKLTLKLDKDIIEKAKIYANQHNISLSKMVEKYFLTIVKENKSESFKPTALVKELSGIINLEKNNLQDDYTDHLINKYK